MIVRVLEREEWGKLEDLGLKTIASAMRPEDVKILVGEEDGRIVSTVGVYRVTHFEGLWIDPEYRGNPGVSRALMRAAVKEAKEWTDQCVWGASGNEFTDSLMSRVGGIKMPVESFVIPLGS